MPAENSLETLKEKLGGKVVETHAFRGDDTAVIAPEAWLEAASLLKKELGFDFLMDLAGADYLPREPRFEVVCHFYSSKTNARLRLKTRLAGEKPAVDSLTSLWLSADWFEREAWDMYGIDFKGHPDLRRLLMYDSFEGHPLRKDYPLKGRQPRIDHKD
ncbi:MAG TPA: NADH-quinone oxidoreductase subunit C [Elusimicrobiales bacterium]|jgi:NADH-quinone oxidoreductase subunit C|nr:NADH-quinone oxidoreductase subunit C [Elusimicrobiales bacterium]